MLYENDLIYIAGFFDGEGSVGVYKRNWDRTKTIQYYTSTATVAQSGKWGYEFVSLLKSEFGGHIRIAPNTDNKKQMYHWQVDADRCATFLKAILPFLRYKREQVELLLEFQTLESKRVDNLQATETADKIKELKKV